MLAGIVALTWWGLKIWAPDSVAFKKMNDIMGSPMWSEGVQDIKALTSDAVKSVDQITDKDKEKLDSILARELKLEKVDKNK